MRTCLASPRRQNRPTSPGAAVVGLNLGPIKVHLGVETDFRPARKAHPAFIVEDLTSLVARLAKAGYPARQDEPLPGYTRVFIDDPFGNRIELLQPTPE